MIGKTFKHFEVIKKLGEGGMGVVYLARNTQLECNVAIKILHNSLSDQKDSLARFHQEAKVMARLNHPNICTIHEIGVTDEQQDYVVMPFYEGKSLQDALALAQLPIAKALSYAYQIAEGLKHAHQTGVIHRDIKPANIFITESGVRILDFGLAKLSNNALTKTGHQLGTLSYMSPEQLQGSKILDHKTDIWSWGIVLFEIITGKHPFGDSFSTIVNGILNNPPPNLDNLPDDQLKLSLQSILDKSLNKSLEERYDSFKLVLNDLSKVLLSDSFKNLDAIITSNPIHQLEITSKETYQNSAEDSVKTSGTFGQSSTYQDHAVSLSSDSKIESSTTQNQLNQTQEIDPDINVILRKIIFLWLFGAGLIVFITFLQTVLGKYLSEVIWAWGWLILSLVPPIMAIFIIIRRVNKILINYFLFKLIYALSLFYLFLVFATLIYAAIDDSKLYKTIFLQSSYWIIPTQLLILLAAAMVVKPRKNDRHIQTNWNSEKFDNVEIKA